MNPRHWEMPPAASCSKVFGERGTQHGFGDPEAASGYQETDQVHVIGVYTAP